MTAPVLAAQPWFVSVLGLCLSLPLQLHPPAFSTALGLELGFLGQVVSDVPAAAHGWCVKLNLRVLLPSRVV